MSREAEKIADPQQLLARLDELEAVARKLQAELDHSSRLATMGVLAGMIAHEFNNILTPILNYSMLALADLENDDLVTKALERNLEGAKSLTRISAAILGFIQQDDEAQACLLTDVVSNTIQCMANQHEKQGVQLVRSIPPRLAVQMQPICLQQVLLNLVLNALEAMKNQAGEIRISAAGEPDGTARVMIADTGCGIPPELIGRIFDPLVSLREKPRQGPRSLGSAKPTGHGLGLAICKRLVEEVGGSISVQSNVGQGTVFTIVLKQAPSESLRRSA